MRLLAVAGLVLGLTVSFAPIVAGGAASKAGSSKPVFGGSLTYVFGARLIPGSLDPLTGVNSSGTPSYTSAAKYWYAIFGALVYQDWTTGKVVPWMAKSLTMKDPSDWVLQLRPGVKFSDGTPFNAQAVAFNWERIGNDSAAPLYATYHTWIDTLTVVNPLTLDIHLNTPNSVFDFTVASYFSLIGSPTQIMNDPTGFATNPVGAGPFVLVSYNSTTGTMVAKKNTTYWDKPLPYLNKLTIESVADPTQRFNTVATGEADIADDMGDSQIILAKAEGFSTLAHVPPYGGQSFAFNTSQLPFSDPSAVKTFEEAINGKALTETVYGSAGQYTDTLFSKTSAYYKASLKFPQYNPKAAQAGFDAYAAKYGKPMTIEFTYASPAYDTLFDYLSAQLEQYHNVTLVPERENRYYRAARVPCWPVQLRHVSPKHVRSARPVVRVVCNRRPTELRAFFQSHVRPARRARVCSKFSQNAGQGLRQGCRDPAPRWRRLLDHPTGKRRSLRQEPGRCAVRRRWDVPVGQGLGQEGLTGSLDPI